MMSKKLKEGKYIIEYKMNSNKFVNLFVSTINNNQYFDRVVHRKQIILCWERLIDLDFKGKCKVYWSKYIRLILFI